MQRHFRYVIVWSMVWLCSMFILMSCVSPRGDLVPFTQAAGNYEGHTWSPNGHWLASDSTDAMALSLFSSDGQLVNTLHLGCEFGIGVGDFSWLPDGRLSCVRSGISQRLLDIFALDQQGQASKSMTITLPLVPHAFVSALQWNPRHFWLAVIATQALPDGPPFLSLVDLAGHNLIVPFRINAERVAWSPDGTTLALVEHGGNVLLFHVQERGKEKLSITPLRTLAVGEARDGGNVEWSPSGRWLVCRHGSYDSEDYLFVAATDGSGKQVKITSSTTEGQVDYPAWSPDGTRLIVSSIAPSGNTLMSLDVNSILKKQGVTP